jgi:hypothetical protein
MREQQQLEPLSHHVYRFEGGSPITMAMGHEVVESVFMPEGGDAAKTAIMAVVTKGGKIKGKKKDKCTIQIVRLDNGSEVYPRIYCPFKVH